MLIIPAPATVSSFFVTEVYRSDFAGTSFDPLITRLDEACRALAAEDAAGQAWADQNGYLGYTSFNSILDLSAQAPAFAELMGVLDDQIAIFAQIAELDLRGQKPKVQQSWVNVLRPGGSHAPHIHRHSSFSGTLYISVPDGAGALQFEDPRLTQMMHAPLRHRTAREPRQPFARIAPARGALLIWESWLRHEVLVNRSDDLRISISFNYDIY
jgi:uncharacterized protein (TIGR02466 family)